MMPIKTYEKIKNIVLYFVIKKILKSQLVPIRLKRFLREFFSYLLFFRTAVMLFKDIFQFFKKNFPKGRNAFKDILH